MNAVPITIGHNLPVHPLEAIAAEYDTLIIEAQNWADGKLIETEEQLTALDVVIKQFRSYKTELTKVGKECTSPLNRAWKDEVARVALHTEDAKNLLAALVSSGSDFRDKLAAEKEAKARAAWEEAQLAKREAQAMFDAANPADIDEMRLAQSAKADALSAQKEALKASKDTVGGMRKVSKFEITSEKELLNWIIKEDRSAVSEFITEYARRNHKSKQLGGVRTWTEKEAY